MIIKQIISIALLLTLIKANLVKVQLQKQSLTNLEQYQDEYNNRFLSKSSQQKAGLFNYFQELYFASVKIGNNQTTFQVIVDTTSSKLMLPTMNCVKNKFSGFSSYYNCTTSDNCRKIDSLYTKSYLAGQVNGVDAVAKGNGILGLSAQNKDNQGNSSFVPTLYSKGYIPKNMFSLYLGYSALDSELTLGGYNPKKIEKNSEIYNHTIVQNTEQQESQWIIPLQKIQLDTFSNTLSSQNNLAVIDSTYPYLGVEDSMYQDMLQYFVQKGAELKGKSYQIDCNTTLADLQFTIKDSDSVERNYTIPFSFYTKESSGKCKILIQSIQGDNNIGFRFGNVFLRRYVSIFDYSKQTVSFAQSIADPDDDYTNLPKWAIILIAVVGSLAVLAGIGYGIYKYKTNKKKNEFSQTMLSNTSA
ncbi:hypothetical protein ABPG74_017180 [Tetrahymena malaccensis]